MVRFSVSGGLAFWRCVFAAILGTLPIMPAHAQTWDGGGADGGILNWSTGTNWTGVPDNTAPVNNGTANVIFDGSFDDNPGPNLDQNWSVNSVTFNSTAGGFVLGSTGGFTLTVQGGGITNNDAQNQSINHTVALGAPQTWNATAGSLQFNNPIVNGGNLLKLAGPAGMGFSGAISGTGGLTVSSGTISLLGGFANTYTGTTTVDGGTLQLGKGVGINALAGNVVVGDGTGTDMLMLLNSDQIPNNTVTVNSSGMFNLNGFNETTVAVNVLGGIVTTGTGTLNVSSTLAMTGGSVASSGAGQLLLAGSVLTFLSANPAMINGNLNLAGGNRSFNIADGTATNDLDVSATVSNGGITKLGSGTMQLSGNNTFIGGVTINAGTLKVNTEGALNGATPNTITFGASSTGALSLNGNSVTIGGLSTNATPGTPIVQNASATFAILTHANNGTETFAGVLQDGAGGGGMALVKTGTGTLTLSGTSANTFSGITSMRAGTLMLSKTPGVNATSGDLQVGDDVGGTNADIVRLGASDQIGGTADVQVKSSGLFDLNGFSETIDQLQLAGGNVTTGAGTLTLGASGLVGGGLPGTSTVSGNLSLGGASLPFNITSGGEEVDISAGISNGGITKTGAGTLTLSGSAPNTYTGVTNFNGGTLILNKSNNVTAVAGNISVLNADLILNAQNQIAATTGITVRNSSLQVQNSNAMGALSLIDSSIVSLNNASTVLTVNGPITANGTIFDQSAIMQINGAAGTSLNLVGSGANITVNTNGVLPPSRMFIIASISGSDGLTKLGDGTLRLDGPTANTLTGTTTINEGMLVLEKNTAGTTALNGNIVVGDGLGGPDADILRLEQDHQIVQAFAETVTVNSSGLFDLNGRTETISSLQLNAGRVAGGTIGIPAGLNSSAQSTSSQINSNVDLLGSTTLFMVNDGTAGDDLLLTGVLQNGTFSKIGPGTLKLAGGTANTATLSQIIDGTVILEKTAGVNALSSAMVIVSDGTGAPQSDILRYGANNNQLPDSIEVRVQSAGLFDLNGRSDAIGTLRLNGSGIVQTGAGTLTVASQVLTGAGAAAGTINGNLNLGGGLRPFNIVNNFPVIDLTVSAAMSNGTLHKQGAGTLALTGSALSSAISYQLDDGGINAGGLNVAAAQSFIQNAPGAFSGMLNNHGAFTYNGGTFSGQLVNKPTGATTFNADFTAAGGLTNEGSISIASGRTLTANGAGLHNDGTINLNGGTLAANSTANFNNIESITGHGLISASSVNFVNVGDIVVSGGDLAINSNFSPINDGTITVPNNLELQLTGTGNTQNAGLIVLNGGRITGPGGITNNIGGEIRGGSGVETTLNNVGGLIRATGTGTLTITSLTGNSAGGELRIDDGATLNVQSAFPSSGTIVLFGQNSTFGGGTVTNNGTLRGLGRVNNLIANSGTIRAEVGTLTLAAAGHTNTAAGRIEAGPGTQVLYSQGLATNSGLIALTGGAFDNNNIALANPGRIEGYGTLRTGGLTNTGTISVGGSLDVLGPVTQNATVSTQSGTTVRFFGPVTGPGSYPGTGTVMFLNTFSPGASPAAVNFGGDVAFTGASSLIIELAGTSPGSQYDTLAVTGVAALAGGLDIDLLDSFVPAAGNVFQIINAAGGIAGSFANVSLPVLSNANWQLRYAADAVVLQVALLGDYNFNGVVDAADYVVWRKTSGQIGFALAADGNANNQIDANDYNVWRANFGNTIGSGTGDTAGLPSSATVPEPARFVLALFGAIMGLAVRIR